MIWSHRPISDEQARTYGEAVLGLAAAARVLPTRALLNWLAAETETRRAGREGATGADPRELLLIAEVVRAAEVLAERLTDLDEMRELINERPPGPRPRAEPPAEAEQGKAQEPEFPPGDPRNEPPPDDWTL